MTHDDEVHASAAVVGVLLLVASPRGGRGLLPRLTGAALVAWAARPFVEREAVRRAERRRSLRAAASIVIQRPVRDVFHFFKDFESFPRVIGGIRSVVDHQDGRSHWETYSPSGTIEAWDVVVTKYLPNAVIGWASVAGSAIEMSGVARFRPQGPSATEVRLEIDYRQLYISVEDAWRILARPGGGNPIAAALDRARFYIESLPAPEPVDDAPPADAKPNG